MHNPYKIENVALAICQLQWEALAILANGYSDDFKNKYLFSMEFLSSLRSVCFFLGKRSRPRAGERGA